MTKIKIKGKIMQIKKNNRAIVFIANQHYSFALASMLVNLKNKLV